MREPREVMPERNEVSFSDTLRAVWGLFLLMLLGLGVAGFLLWALVIVVARYG
jgi:hypothetical protein